MKIGIITWFSYENYGTALQAYALQSFISSNGHDCEILNYLPNSLCKEQVTTKKKICLRKLKDKVCWKKDYIMFRIARLKIRNKMKIKSNSFKKFINNNCILTERLDSKSSLIELNKQIDTYICGSDQIWTPNALDGTYYLDFVDDNNKRISYAPSFGVTQIPDEYKSRVACWISKFDFLSVREKQGEKIIEDLTGIKPAVVLDPTLLLKSNDWDNICNVPNIDEPYILCYFLGDKSEYWKTVKKLQKITGYKVVIIPITPKSYFKKGIVLPETGPEEFIGLIKNAEIILTDSFHGTVFSINYKKNFYVFKRFNDKDKVSQNSRIYNILEKLNLENRLIDNVKSISDENINILNYQEVDYRLNKERERAIDFLNKSLKN